jgi:hypothetical protein
MNFIITGRRNATPGGLASASDIAVRHWTQPVVTQWSPQFALIVTRPWVWPTSKPWSVCPSTRTDTREAWQETYRWSVGIPSPYYPTNPTTPVIGRKQSKHFESKHYQTIPRLWFLLLRNILRSFSVFHILVPHRYWCNVSGVTLTGNTKELGKMIIDE